ncbi:MAG: hypothetical protein ACFFB5_16580 [Promethearchaeota archaeon]
MFYNLIKGENTVLRGLIAEEFARYILSQRFPILVIRPAAALRYLETTSIQGRNIDFLQKNQKTMDFLGITPYFQREEFQLTPKETIYKFFNEEEGLNRYLRNETHFNQLKGFVIEVKSRTSTNSWAPFRFSFSPNQEEMLVECQKLNFDIILCGVTFTSDWNLSVVFCDRQQKILSEDFFVIN